MLSAANGDVAVVFIELGAVALALAALARLAGHLEIPAIPFFLLGGLAVGEGGLVPLDVSEEFISLAAQIGLLLLLLALGLEYTGDELRAGLRAGGRAGLVDVALNFTLGLAFGLLLGWEPTAAVLLGGVTWISSSGVVAKLLADFGWVANRETPAVLNLLVVEDLAMAVYLPIASALVADQTLGETGLSIGAALIVVGIILAAALRYGDPLSRVLSGSSDESLLLAVFGLTLLVGGLAEQVHVSAGIGAFLVGLALSEPVQHRAGALTGPLRDLFAATFFFSFSFQLQPETVLDAAVPGLLLAALGIGSKLVTASVICAPLGIGRRGRLRAGSALAARGEFSIVIASLGASAADGDQLGAVAAAFVLVSAIFAPVMAKFVDRQDQPVAPGS